MLSSLSSISPSSHDTSAMQSEAHASIRLECAPRHLLDTHSQRTEAAYAISVLAAGVLLLFTAL